MKTGAAIVAALVWAIVALAADTTRRERPSGTTTAGRLRFEFAPPAATPTNGKNPTAPSAAEDTPVIRLPRMEVRDRPIPLAEHELLTPKGRLDAARRSTLSPAYRATFGPLSWAAMLYFNPLALLSGAKPNDAEAMALYEQNEAIRREREIRGLEELGVLAGQAAIVERRADESAFRPASRGTRGGE